MTLLVTGYKSKKELKENIGKSLLHEETSIFGIEYKSNGSFVVANRPHITHLGREFFAQVTMQNDKIVGVK